MKVVLGIVSAILSSLFLQTTWFANFSPKPDGVLAVILAIALLKGPLTGAITGFSAGLAQEVLCGMSHGSFCLAGLLVGWVFGSVFKRFDSSNLVVVMLGAIAGSVLYYFVFKGLTALLGVQPNLHFALGWALLQGILCVAFLLAFKRWLFPETLEL